jgi:hypothetical protein
VIGAIEQFEVGFAFNARQSPEHHERKTKKGTARSSSGPSLGRKRPRRAATLKLGSGVTIQKLYVQRTICNCEFCNAARTTPGSVLTQFEQVGGRRAQTAKKIAAKKIAALAGGHESREETPNGR